MPKLMASTTAMTEAQTEVAPLMPQSQGVMAEAFFEANFMPRGNGIPMKKPIGASMKIEMRMRIWLGWLW